MDKENLTLVLSSGYIDTAEYNEAEGTYDFAIVGCQHAEIDQDVLFGKCGPSFKDATRTEYCRISVREDVVKKAMMTDTVDDIDPAEFLGRQIVLNSKGLDEFRALIVKPDQMYVDAISFPIFEHTN